MYLHILGFQFACFRALVIRKKNEKIQSFLHLCHCIRILYSLSFVLPALDVRTLLWRELLAAASKWNPEKLMDVVAKKIVRSREVLDEGHKLSSLFSWQVAMSPMFPIEHECRPCFKRDWIWAWPWQRTSLMVGRWPESNFEPNLIP